jgi:hypothetical protein
MGNDSFEENSHILRFPVGGSNDPQNGEPSDADSPRRDVRRVLAQMGVVSWACLARKFSLHSTAPQLKDAPLWGALCPKQLQHAFLCTLLVQKAMLFFAEESRF